MTSQTENQTLTLAATATPVAVTRAYAKARMGDLIALRWLVDQHRAGNHAATKALEDLERLMPKAETAFVA